MRYQKGLMKSEQIHPIFHIGFHKTGTTFLQKNLFESHPSLQRVNRFSVNRIFIFPNDLEYSKAGAREFVKNEMEKAKRESCTPIFSNEGMTGGHSTGGYNLVRIAERIHHAAPDARILIVIREQRSMLLSLHAQYIKAFGSLSFAQYINPTHTNRNEVFHSVTLEYDRLIEEYISKFGSSCVKVLPFELLAVNPTKFIRGVAELCGLDPNDPHVEELDFQSPLNQRKSLASAEFRRLTNPLIRNDIPQIGSTYYFSPLAFALRAIVRLSESVPTGAIDRRIAAHRGRIVDEFVSKKYGSSNSRTSSQIGMNLCDLGYVCG
jgi:hypothetical protein